MWFFAFCPGRSAFFERICYAGRCAVGDRKKSVTQKRVGLNEEIQTNTLILKEGESILLSTYEKEKL